MKYTKQLSFALIFLTTAMYPNAGKRAALQAVEARLLHVLDKRSDLMLQKHIIYQEFLSLCACLANSVDYIKKRFADEQIHLLEQLDILKKQDPSISKLEKQINLEQALNSSLQKLNQQEQNENNDRMQKILALFYEIQEIEKEIENLDAPQPEKRQEPSHHPERE